MRTLALLIVCGCSLAAARADDAAKAIVEKARKATGWDKRTSENATWKEKGKWTAAGKSIDYNGNFHVTFPDKFRFDLEMKVSDQTVPLTVILNGDKAWEKMGTMAQDMAKEKVKYSQTEVYAMQVFSMMTLLSDKEFTLSKIDDGDVNGKKCVGISVTKKDKPDVKIWFDAETGIPAKLEYKTTNEFEDWKECTDAMYPSDWTDDAPGKSFKKMKVTRNDKTMLESELSDYKMPDKVDPKMFEKP